MKKIMMKLDRISCRESTLLSTKKLEGKITLIERIQLWYHQKLCKVCKLWEKQIMVIDDLLRSTPVNNKETGLTDEDKESIKSKINP